MPFVNEPDDYEPDHERSPVTTSLNRKAECRPCGGSGLRSIAGRPEFCANCSGTGTATSQTGRKRYSWGVRT